MIDFGFDLARREEPLLWRGALVSALGAVTEVIPLVVAAVVIDGVFSKTASWAWVGGSAGVLAVGVGLTWLLKSKGGTYSFIATYGLVCDARLNLADHLRKLPMGFWTQQRTGSVGSLLTDEFALYTEIVTHTWTLVVANIAKPVAIALVLLVVHWRLGLVAILTFPPAVASIPWSHRLLDRASDDLAEVRWRAHAQLVEFAQGVTTLREYGATGPFQARLDEVLGELSNRQMRTELAPAPALFTYKLLVWLGFSLLMSVGAWGVAAQWIEPVRFLLVALLSLQLFESASELSNHLTMARFASRTLERIRAVFDLPVQADGRPGVRPVGAELRVESGHFAYAERSAVAGVDAVFESGTVTALVGPSGSGKSTLAHLLARLWDLDGGLITLGGVDIREIPLAELRRQIAMVLQDVVLFRETVEDNIRLGRPDASREEVVSAARAARAHAFIEQLPEGYDTVLGEGGADLSGGQRQRISIARALLQDAPILILDEATSSVDTENEFLIQQAISELTRGRTVVVIAHRLWTVQHADQILVLSEGAIVERGTHTELIAERGLYRRMWDIQQAGLGWTLTTSTRDPDAAFTH